MWSTQPVNVCSVSGSLHFPPSIYRSSGSSQVLPDLLKSLDIANVRAIQFVPNGVVGVTFREPAQCDAALASDVSFRGTRLRVSPVDARNRLVYVRDLPFDDLVKLFLPAYVVVHSLTPQVYPGMPNVLS